MGVPNRCGGSRAAAAPDADRVVVALEPETTVVARLREAFRDAPDAKRFVIHANDPPPLGKGRVGASGTNHPFPLGEGRVGASGTNHPPPLGEGRVGDAVSVIGVPVSDTCKEVVDGLVRRTIPRENLALAGGPWVFTREALAEALARIAGHDAQIPDMIGFCEAAHLRVRVLPAR